MLLATIGEVAGDVSCRIKILDAGELGTGITARIGHRQIKIQSDSQEDLALKLQGLNGAEKTAMIMLIENCSRHRRSDDELLIASMKLTITQSDGH